MTYNEIIEDIKFRDKCAQYGLDWENCVIFDEVILLYTPTKGLYVLFDKNYNTICIDKSPFFDAEKFAKHKYFEYSTFSSSLPFEDGFNYPFEEFTLKNIIDLSNRIEIMENNHGHSLSTKVNGDWYDRNLKGREDYFQLLSYIKFLGEEIKLYFLNTYHMLTMGFEVPNIYEYIRTLMERLNECVDFHLEHSRRPWPQYILSGLGQNFRELKMDSILFDVADLLMRQKGYKVRSGSPDEIEMIDTKNAKQDLYIIAHQLLELLKLSDEDVKNKEKQNMEKFVQKNLDNIRPYLEEDIEDDVKEEKGPILEKKYNKEK